MSYDPHLRLDHIRGQFYGIDALYPSAGERLRRRLRDELDLLEEHLLGDRTAEAIELRTTIHSLVLRCNPWREA